MSKHETAVQVDINGKTYDMVFTTAALLQVTEKFGGVEEMGKLMDDKSTAEGLRAMLWLIVLLVNQGTMLATGITRPDNPDLLTVDGLALYLMPGDIRQLADKAMDAIRLGMGMETKPTDADQEIDVVLEELEAEKNGGGAAV